MKNLSKPFFILSSGALALLLTACATTQNIENALAGTEPVVPNEDIYFSDYSYQLSDNSKQYADQIAEYLSDNPDVKLKITGNIDPQLESDIYNFHLADRRAEQLRNYLISKGVAKDQVCHISNLNQLSKNAGMLDTLSYLNNCSG